MKLLAVLNALLLSGAVYALPLHHIVVFGDSLSDNGNLYERMDRTMPPSPPYFDGRFSNGPVWVEHLAASYFADPIKGLEDYAVGGAGVSEEGGDELFTFKQEIDAYLLEHRNKFRADDLYIVWIGANNYLGMPDDAEKALHDVNAGITHGLEEMVKKGAKYILVMNLPDLGRTPAAIEFKAVEAFTYFSEEHNKALKNSLTRLKRSYPAVKWLFFDANQLFSDAMANPANFGITHVIESCYASSPVEKRTEHTVLQILAAARPRAPDLCEGYLFFDLIHPTLTAQKVVADKVRSLLDIAGIVIKDHQP